MTVATLLLGQLNRSINRQLRVREHEKEKPLHIFLLGYSFRLLHEQFPDMSIKCFERENRSAVCSVRTHFCRTGRYVFIAFSDMAAIISDVQ